MSEGNNNNAALISFISGLIGGTVSKTIDAPFLRVKLLLQNQRAIDRIGKDTPLYKGIANCFSRVMKEQGFTSLFRGNVIALVSAPFTLILNFIIKDSIKNTIQVNKNQGYSIFMLKNLLVGGLSGGLGLLFTYPFNFARTRLALDIGRTP